MANPYGKYLAAMEILFSSSDSDLGTPDEPTKDGFLELVQSGSNVWNAWRHEFPEVIAEFRESTFGKKAVFSNFILENTHGHGPNFFKSSFPYGADFENTSFGNNSKFEQASFGGSANFSKATFGNSTSFEECRFEKKANFIEARFGERTKFTRCFFRTFALFTRSSFGESTSFFKAKLGDEADFNKSKFGKETSFRGATFGTKANFSDCIFQGRTNFSAENKDDTPLSAKLFHNIFFDGSQFNWNVDFSGREFRGTTYFGNSNSPGEASRTVFRGIPLFHSCKLHQDTSFDDAQFLAPPSQEAARAYRTLKLAMEQLKATREEQRFFRLEMKSEHPSLPRGKRWISTLYGLFSDYGFSLWRPAVWLLGLSILFGIGYGALANACASNTECSKIAWAGNTGSSEDRTSAVIKYTLASIAPVPGFDKMQTELRAPIFGHHGWVPITALILEIFHKIAALVMVFLFALALRNLFKMKS